METQIEYANNERLWRRKSDYRLRSVLRLPRRSW